VAVPVRTQDLDTTGAPVGVLPRAQAGARGEGVVVTAPLRYFCGSCDWSITTSDAQVMWAKADEHSHEKHPVEPLPPPEPKP
jgi:hypothetical protein